MAKVWVTYDPLLEKIICVHDEPDCLCKDCKPIWDERTGGGKNVLYQLEEFEFEIRESKNNELINL